MSQQSFHQQTATGADINFTIDTFESDEIKVYVDGVLKTAGNDYNINPYNTNSQSTVDWIGTAPSSPSIVRIVRETDILNAGNTAVEGRATYQAGSSVKADDLNNNQKQVLRALQEHNDQKVQTYDIEDGAITSAKIKDLTIVDADISATAEIEVYKLKDGTPNQVLVTQNDGNTVNWSSNIDLPGTLDVAGNVDFDGNLDVDGDTNLDNTNIAGSLYVVGTALVDNVLIDDNSIESGSGNLNLSSTYGNVSVNDNLAVTGTLNVTQGVTLQNASATVNGSQIVTETATQTLSNKTLTTPVINDMSGTAVVTSGTSTSDNKVYSAKRAGEIFYGKGTVEEIQSGETWAAADDKVATTAAIDARIIDLVDDVGGFVPIANETSFPDENPDINNASNKKGGTIVSIKSVSSSRTPSNGTVSIANGNVSNNQTITINGCGSTVLAAGFGVLVETTQTDHTYNFHRLVPKATEVTTVAANATQIGTVHTNITQVQTVHDNINNINAVAADATDIGTVAARDTEIGRLGTAAAVEDLSILGTADVVSDLNTLGTADVVADMNMLATSDVIADMNMLAVSDVISDMDALATNDNITAMDTCRDNITSIINASTNISSANNFGDQYQVASNNPSTDGGGNALAAGDLYFNTSANELKVYNGSAWQSGVTATGNFATVTGNTFTGDNRYNDGVKALFGTGSDLEIYHNGSNSYLKNSTGWLNILSNTVFLGNYADTEAYLKAVNNGSVELYYDHSKKLYTESDGIAIDGSISVESNGYIRVRTTGDNSSTAIQLANDGTASFDGVITASSHIDMPDNAKLLLGTGDDLQIYHDGSTSYVSNVTDTGLLIRNLGNGDIKIKPQNSYPVELYYNGGKKFETTSYGAAITSSGSSHGLKVFHSNGNEVASLTHGGSGDEGVLVLKDSAATTIVLRGENGTDVDITTGGNFDLEHDSAKLRLGAGNDLQIYFDGSIGVIKNASNDLAIRSDGNIKLEREDGGEDYIHCIQDGGVEVHYDGSVKLVTTSSGIDVTGNIVQSSGSYIDMGAGDLYTDDGGKLRLGTSSDLQIYHDGSDSVLTSATGSLNFGINNSFNILGGTDLGEYMARFIDNGAVQLYYDGSKKLETASDKINFHAHAKVNADATYDLGASGARWNDLYIANNIYLKDAGELRLGDSGDLQIYHDGNNSIINDTGTGRLKLISNNVQIRNAANTETIAEFIQDGSVELYENGTKVAETTTGGWNVEGVTYSNGLDMDDNHKILLGVSDDLEIYHNGDNYINIQYDQELRLTHGSDYMARFLAEGGVMLYHDNVVKLETRASDVWIRDDLILADGDKIKLGDGNDLEMYHLAGQTNVIAGSGPLTIQTDDTTTGISLQTKTGGETMARFIKDGAAELYHNNTKRLETQSWGVSVTGNVSPSATDTHDLGASGARWANLYVNDMHFANSPENVNCVDGTWGDWTLQEGEETIYMLNNRNGKKYKMALQEVS